MDWTARIGRKQGVLDRIVMVLFALARLATRAASAPGPLRWLALWALQQADMVAKEFVADFEYDLGRSRRLPAAIPVRYGNDPADAMQLALSLRRLALTIRILAAQADTLPDLRWTAGGSGRDVLLGRLVSNAICAAACVTFAPAHRCDTS